MNKFSKILEGSKILAITDKNGREYRFVGDREREKVSAKMTYYLWLSRFFIVFPDQKSSIQIMVEVLA